MRTIDFFKLTGSAVTTQRMRSLLTISSIAIGITAVVLLTSIGQGIHRFVLTEFTQFGTTLIAINPGKATTMGTSVGVFGTERPLIIADAIAMKQIPGVKAVVPVTQGNAEVEGNDRRRRTTVYGVGPEFPTAFTFAVGTGNFLPHDNPESPRAFAVLGSKLKHELYENKNPLGQYIRIGGSRYRIVGVMESKGQVLGFDLDDTVYIPTARALELFNRDSLMEIDVIYHKYASETEVVKGIKRILMARHGREDFTITTQQQMLDVLGNILDILTFAAGALGGISLLVGAVGILTIMTISVSERTHEIGLFRAIGAERQQILWLFLGEAVFLAGLGGLAGLVIGVGIGKLIVLFAPAFPVEVSWFYIFLAEGVAVLIGLLAGIYPAQKASRMNPIEALRTE